MVNDSIDNLRLDLNKPKARASISVRRGDTKTRTIHISLTSNGAVYSLADVLMAELLITKPDGKVCDQDMVIKGNELQYTFRTQDTNVEGECVCQIRLTFKDGARLASPEFYMYVYKMILDQKTSQSENEYSQTDALLSKANEYYENAEKLADTIESHVNDAIDAASASAESASEAETYYLAAKQYAEDAEQSKDLAAESEEKIEQFALDAQQAAEDAKQSEENAKQSEDNALISETNAKESEEAAIAAKEAAEEAAEIAQAVAAVSIATEETAGIVKPDGTTVTVDPDGTIHAVDQTPIASTTEIGAVKPDGTTITVEPDGTIKATGNTSPIATTETAGIVIPDGETITVDPDGTIHGSATVDIATTEAVGTVKPDGTTITVDPDGTIKAADQTKVATTTTLGSVIADSTSITVDADGKIHSTTAIPYTNTNLSGVSDVKGALDSIATNFQVGVNTIISSVNTKTGAESGDENYLDGNSTPTDIADVISNISGGEEHPPVLLWTNPNPTSAFAGQTVELDLTNYVGVLIEVRSGTADTDIGSVNYIKIGETKACGRCSTNTSRYGGMRTANVNTNGVEFGSGFLNTTSNENVAIPTKIYGVQEYVVEEKTTLEDAPVLLWSNPNPTAAFNAQTVNVDLTDYKGVIVKYRRETTYDTLVSRLLVNKGETLSMFGGGFSTDSSAYVRLINSVTDRGVEFAVGRAAGTTNNSICIPTEIYGVKKAVVEVESNAPELLWVNANPNSTFASQTINLDLSGYEGVEIEYNFNDVGIITNHVIGKKNENSVTLGITDYSTYKSYNFRKCNISDTGVTFEGGLYTMNNNPSSVLSTNDSIIPTKIYGVKGVITENIDTCPQITEYLVSKGATESEVDTVDEIKSYLDANLGGGKLENIISSFEAPISSQSITCNIGDYYIVIGITSAPNGGMLIASRDGIPWGGTGFGMSIVKATATSMSNTASYNLTWVKITMK